MKLLKFCRMTIVKNTLVLKKYSEDTLKIWFTAHNSGRINKNKGTSLLFPARLCRAGEQSVRLHFADESLSQSS